MKIGEAHIAFNLELDKSSISGYPSFLPEEKDYFLNLAIKRIYKTKYSGANIKLKSMVIIDLLMKLSE